MIEVSNLSLRFGKRILFDEVNLKFTPGNCYGVIGANGAGKSTFLKILSSEIDPTSGQIFITPGERMSVLRQNHFEFDDYPVLETVIRGNQKLWDIKSEIDAIYAKEDFSEEDGIRAGELSAEFEDINGWNAESDAAGLLSNVNIPEDLHYTLVKDLNGSQKVRVLLSQALFGNPDILLLDEPTNDLDLETINWLEDFLAEFKNTVIVVSHDRHFLDSVCTHIVDIDFGKIQQFVGNYSFWYESSQLAARQRSDKNKKVEDKRKELQAFIERFSANASKSRQATSRKKLLEKLTLEDIQPSARKYPAIIFKQEREAGNQVLEVHDISAMMDDQVLFSNVTFEVQKGDKIGLLAQDGLSITRFFEIINNRIAPQSGYFKWGVTITPAYLPNDNSDYFKVDLNLIDWLRQYSTEKDETFIRGFLGRMLFSGEETFKKCNVLSGGEKVRCMVSRMMLQSPNFLMLDEPTNHLDLESITAFNNSLVDYPGMVILHSHDHQFMQTVSNRIVELTPTGVIDRYMSYDDYIVNEDIKALRKEMYMQHA